jgi:hypothetical protein
MLSSHLNTSAQRRQFITQLRQMHDMDSERYTAECLPYLASSDMLSTHVFEAQHAERLEVYAQILPSGCFELALAARVKVFIELLSKRKDLVFRTCDVAEGMRVADVDALDVPAEIAAFCHICGGISLWWHFPDLEDALDYSEVGYFQFNQLRETSWEEVEQWERDAYDGNLPQSLILWRFFEQVINTQTMLVYLEPPGDDQATNLLVVDAGESTVLASFDDLASYLTLGAQQAFVAGWQTQTPRGSALSRLQTASVLCSGRDLEQALERIGCTAVIAQMLVSWLGDGARLLVPKVG